MTFNDYQKKASSTVIYPEKLKIVYPLIGMTGETGEVAEKIKKVLRDNKGEFSDEKKAEIALEVGDVLWYLSSLASDLGYTLDEIAEMNINKILSRKERNVIHGNGDNR
jgi:NTP pyrophosphatase (non-canonical NTP hydrolase)